MLLRRRMDGKDFNVFMFACKIEKVLYLEWNILFWYLNSRIVLFYIVSMILL